MTHRDMRTIWKRKQAISKNNKIKYSLLLGILLFVGCLVPGAPHFYYYKSNRPHGYDSIKVISTPGRLEYKYYFKDELDSILIYDPIDRNFQRMTRSDDSMFFYFRKNETSNLKKIEKVKKLVLKKVISGKVHYDTLYLFTPEWEKVYK